MDDNISKEQENLHYRFFSNTECPYYPCHEWPQDKPFNCLFCYCPLYALGSGCGGNCRYLESGIKDCSGCTLPHSEKGYDYITGRFREVAELAKQNR